MKALPIKFREMGDQRLLISNDAGGFFVSDEGFLERYVDDRLSAADWGFLDEAGFACEETSASNPAFLSYAYRWSRRHTARNSISYAILVPTLRCNLTCSYCQVSRAPEAARGFDWPPETASQVIRFLDRLTTDSLKVEFQGGEPLLRLDLLDEIRSFCRARFHSAEFVVCTNLQSLREEHWAFLAAPDTFVSTSLDVDRDIHRAQRTKEQAATEIFFCNLDRAVSTLGDGKVSALPTIDVNRLPSPQRLLDGYLAYGLSSIYLRPVNFHGFARRNAPDENAQLEAWNRFFADFIESLIEHNWRSRQGVEEFYFVQCLRRVLRFDADNHVDLRNPNFLASDYIVVDFDGRLYPTDEARMLSRIRRIDLSVGSVGSGLDVEKVRALNSPAFNDFDPDCIHCAFQPYCGSDPIDDISRYGRIDLPRPDTWFCRRHTAIFDKVFELLYRDDEPTRYSLTRWLGLVSWPSLIAPRHVL